MRLAQRGYVQTLRSKAPPEAIWRALVDPVALAAWGAQRANVDGRVGGRYSVHARLLGQREAHIDVFEPNRRLRLILEPAPNWPPTGDEVIVEDFMIDSNGAESVLRLIGSGVPGASEWDATLKRLRSGWAVSFADLRQHLGSIRTENPAS